MSNKKYAVGKPKDCSLCFFWKNARQGCSLGKENCYFIISEPEKEKSDCDGCPYGRVHPCIGWCTIQIMREIGIKG